jgi:hypothetical protein
LNIAGNRHGWHEPEDHPLRQYVRRIGWSEDKAMNALQEHGIISDNSITIDDVGNYARAMMWLHERIKRKEL